MSSNGKAAEFFAAAELVRHGWNIVYLGGNFKDSDLCIENEKEGRVLWIQVKAFQVGSQKVILKKPQAKRWIGDNKWYIFVGLPKDPNLQPTHYYCLPSSEVHEHASSSHDLFVGSGGKDTDFWGFNLTNYASKKKNLLIPAHNANRLHKADRNFEFKIFK